MSTPAPHVPISLLLAGGSAAFSAECVDAMIACRINPNWVGTYRSVLERRNAAGERVRAWQDAIRNGTTPRPPRPSFEDRWLSASTAGHLDRDAANRRGERGDNCATIVHGYTERGAAAMATLGAKGQQGTVEDDVSRLERAQSARRRDDAAAAARPTGLPASDAYPADQRRDDRNARVDAAVASHRRNFPDGLASTPVQPGKPPPTTPRQLADLERDRRMAIRGAEGAGPNALGARGPAAPGAAGTPGEPTVPLVSPTNPTGTAEEIAADCIKTYCDRVESREGKIAGVNQEIRDQRARMQDPAQMAPYNASEQKLRQRVRDEEQRVADARTNVRDAEQAIIRHDTAVRGYNAAGDAARAQAAAGQERDLLQRSYARAETLESRERELAIARASLASHQQTHPARQVQCLQDQRARLQAGNPESVGRIPIDGEQ